MLLFHVTFRCRSGARDEFLEKIRTEGIDAAARAEAGNLRYDWYIPVDNDSDLFLIEAYRDGDAVAEHVRQAHTARLAELKEAYAADVILEKFEV